MTLNEQAFRKMGWRTLSGFWVDDTGFRYEKLPPVSSVWEVTAKYLVKFMREKKYRYSMFFKKDMNDPHFIWITAEPLQTSIYKEIKNDDLALAACESFMEVELNVNL